MSNTLATITPHGWILALFIRDDGERLLLGDGYYEFKEEQRHFVANTYINDVVELQGTDGQLIAGQVRRSQAQAFDGYICDPTIDQATTEQKRRDFFLFFRKNHEYKVVYIFPNGEAIQRKGGYIVDAPEIREIIQRSPEYHVALAFEDVNYYTYAEAPDGSEKYTYEADLAPVFATDGGLVWDGIGMTSDSQSLVLNGINGGTFQQGTPSPDSPQPIRMATGSQTITIKGTNYPLDLGTIELNGLGDDGNGNPLYKDRIFKDGNDWKIRKEIGKITFDSSTGWTKHSSTNGNVFMLGNTGLIGYAYGSGVAAPAVMNTDTAVALGSVSDRAYGVFGINNTTQIRVFRGVYSSSYTAATFKSEMIGKSIYGALVDATDTTIADQTLIAQLEAIRSALAGGGKITITPTGDNLAVKLDTTSAGTGGLIWEASSSGTPITVNIQGVDKTYPILEITGPAVDPVLTNITTGEEFFWTGTVPLGQTLRVDMREMTATLNGANVFEFVSGSWVGFEPGPNTVRYTAASATYPAKIYYNEVVG